MNMRWAFLRRIEDWESVITALLLFAGVLFRIWYIVDFSASPLFPTAIGADVEEYFARAREILSGTLLPVVPDIHAPVYPFFMAGFFRVVGIDIPGLRIFQLSLNYCGWFFIYMLLRRIGIDRRVRMVFLGAGMLLPVPFFYQAELISESLLLPELAVFLWLIYAAEKNSTYRSGICSTASGVMLGIMNLTHPMTLFFSVAEIAFHLWKKRFRQALLIAIGVLVVVGSFCVVSSFHYGELRGIQSNAPFNLYLGNNESSTGGCYMRPGMRWRNTHRKAAAEAAAQGKSVDVLWWGRIGRFWLEHPLKGVSLWVKKAFLVFAPGELPSGADVEPLIYFTKLVFYGRMLTPLIFFFAFFGIWSLYKERFCGYGHFLLLVVSLFAIQVLSVTSGRYRLLMLTGVFLFAAAGICRYRWRYWYLPVLLTGISGLFTITDYGKNIGEAASLYAGAAFIRGEYAYADELAAFAGKRASSVDDPARLLNLRGACAGSRRDFRAAAEFYRKAAELEPEMPQAWMNLASLPGVAPEKADEFYKKALKISPDEPLVCYNYALFLCNNNRAGEAERYLNKALAADHPATHGAWNLAGIFAMKNNNFVRAAECFERAAFFSPAEMRENYLNNRRIALEAGGKR